MKPTKERALQVERIVPSELSGDEQWRRNGEYVAAEHYDEALKRTAELEAILASQTVMLEQILQAAGYSTGQTYSADGIVNRLREQGAG